MHAGEIVGPYELVRLRTRQLHHLHGTIDALRCLILRIKLVQKLRQLLSAASPQAGGMAAPAAGGTGGAVGGISLDLAKAAKLITDIRAVDAEARAERIPLDGLDVVVVDEGFLREAITTVRQQAEV